MRLKFKKARKEQKIFCIGFNKTGTTSLGYLFEKNGIEVAKQREGELLLNSYINRNFDKIINYCKNSSAVVFQDVPFSLPYTYQFLFNAFPDSKFILTVRNSAEEWYRSLVKFHSDFYCNNNKIDKKALIESDYVYYGWSWELMNEVFFKDCDILYDEERLCKIYIDHIEDVKHFFKKFRDRLLIVNLANKSDLKTLGVFLEIEFKNENFPRITSKDILTSVNCNFLEYNDA